MVQVSSILAAAGYLLAYSGLKFVSGSPTVAVDGDAALEGYTIGQIHWKGYLEAGKQMVYLSGDSLEDVDAKAKALDPSYTIFASYNSSAEEAARLAARQTQVVNCGLPSGWGAGSRDPAWEGVWFLQGITGWCRANAGPAACGRVTCSSSTGIYYCNDNSQEHWEPCAWIGDVAMQIINECGDYDNVANAVWGQAFDLRNWNTIVARGSC